MAEVKEVEDRTARSGPVRNYMDLLVYKQAYGLALEISRLTRTFPRSEQYELGRQLRASSRSVVANIVEGWAKRHSAAEFKRHLLIAGGEGAETRFWLDLATDEGIASKDRSEPLKADYSKLGMMIHNLWREWRKLT
jgi:four helix bundle protein